jgi:hypothetical protein
MGTMVDEPWTSWVDDVLADSFPASDPPPWVPGMARPAPAGSAGAAGRAPSSTVAPGDLVPHFEVTTLAGDRFEYSSIWQRRNLVLVTLPSDSATPEHSAWLAPRARAAPDNDTAWVVTADRVAHVPYPGVVVADQWGEVVHVAAAPLPSPDEVAQWVHGLEMRCPECEGEAK